MRYERAQIRNSSCTRPKKRYEKLTSSTFDEIGSAARGETDGILEEGSVGKSQGNGVGVPSVQSAIKMPRARKVALEESLKVDIPERPAVLRWMLADGGWVLNRYEPGQDGKTVY